MANRARRVNLCRWADRGSGVAPGGNFRGVGGRGTLFAFGWEDLAVLLGLQAPEVKKLAKSGAFDPQDLESIAAFWLSRRSAQEERLDPAARAREKQASRDADAADLDSGRKTRAQLRAENAAFAFPRDRVRVDVGVRKIRR